MYSFSRSYKKADQLYNVCIQISIEDEYADDLAQYLADDNYYLQAEIKRNKGLLFCEIVRHGGTFMAWERCELYELELGHLTDKTFSRYSDKESITQ